MLIKTNDVIQVQCLPLPCNCAFKLQYQISCSTSQYWTIRKQ